MRLKDLGVVVTFVQNLTKAGKVLSAEEIALAASSGALTASQEAVATSMLATAGAEGTATVATGGLSAAFKGLWATITAHPLIAIATAIAAVVYATVRAKKKMDEAAQERRDKTIEAGKAAQKEAQEVRDLYQAYIDANEGYKNGTVTKEEYKTATDKLLDSLGDEGERIRSLRGDYEGLTEEIDKATEAALREAYANSRASVQAKRESIEAKYGSVVFGGKNPTATYANNAEFENTVSDIILGAIEGATVSTGLAGERTLFFDQRYNNPREYYNQLIAARDALLSATEFDENGERLFSMDQLVKSSIYQAIVAEIETMRSDFEELDELISSANKLLISRIVLAFDNGKDVHSLKEYKEFRQRVIDEVKETGEFDGDLAKLPSVVESYLLSSGAFDKFFSLDWFKSEFEKFPEQFREKLVEFVSSLSEEQLKGISQIMDPHFSGLFGLPEEIASAFLSWTEETGYSAEEVVKYILGMTADGTTSAESMIAGMASNTISSFGTIRDELAKTAAAWEEYKNSISDADGGEHGGMAKQIAEAYNTAIADIDSGKINNKSVIAAGRLFFGDAQLAEWNYDAKVIAQQLKSTMLAEFFSTDDSDADIGKNFISYLIKHASEFDFTHIIQDPDTGTFKFWFDNLEGLAKDLNITEAAAAAFVDAMSAYSSQSIISQSDIEKLAITYQALYAGIDGVSDETEKTAEAVKQFIQVLHSGDTPLNKSEIFQVLLALKQSGVIKGDVIDLYEAIDDVLTAIEQADGEEATVTVNAETAGAAGAIAEVGGMVEGVEGDHTITFTVDIPDFDGDKERAASRAYEKFKKQTRSLSADILKALGEGRDLTDAQVAVFALWCEQFGYTKDDIEDLLVLFEKLFQETPSSSITLESVTARAREAEAELTAIQTEIAERGIDITRTVFGNIDTDNRQLLEWTEENIQKYREALESWGETADDLLGSVSTVFGTSADFNGIEIAFSPILQTEDGPVLLSQDTVYEYIYGLIDKAKEQAGDGDWTSEILLDLDTKGLEVDGYNVKNMLAAIGNEAIAAGEAMHYVGRSGALAIATDEADNAKASALAFLRNYVLNDIAGLGSLRDEIAKTAQAWKEYQDIIAEGDPSDQANQFAEAWDKAMKDIENGRIDTPAVWGAAKLFFTDEQLASWNYDLRRAAQELNSDFIRELFAPPGEGEDQIDPGVRFAKYLYEHADQFTSAHIAGGPGNFTFWYDSLEGLARDLNLSEEATTALLRALDAFGVESMQSSEDVQRLAADYRALYGTVNNSGEALKEFVTALATGENALNEAQIMSNLKVLRAEGVIEGDDEQFSKVIQEVFAKLGEVDNTTANPTVELQGVSETISQASSLRSSLEGIFSSPIVQKVTVVKDEAAESSSDDKKYALGTRNAPGGISLVNEKGPELISDGGKAFIANRGKPGFVNLGKGAVVFTADETREIFRHGYPGIPVRAYANGTGVNRNSIRDRLINGGHVPGRMAVATADVGGGGSAKPKTKICPHCGDEVNYNVNICPYCSYNFSTGTIGIPQPTKPAQSTTATTMTSPQTVDITQYKPPSSGSTQTGGGGGGGYGGGGYGGSDYSYPSTPEEPPEPQKVDWIAVAISRIQKAIETLEKIASSGFKKLSTRLAAAKEQVKDLTKEIEINQKGYERYIQEANSVGLKESIAEKVRAGTIDINEYDEDTKKLIDEYTEWYEKAIDCKLAVVELRQEVANLNQEMFNAVQTDYENKLAQITHTMTMINKDMSMAQTQGYMDSVEYYKRLSASEQDNLRMLQAELKDLNVAFKSAMDSGEIAPESEAWYEMAGSIHSVEEAIADAQIKLAEYEKTMRSIEWGYFDYAMERFNRLSQEADFLTKVMANDKLYNEQGHFTRKGRATAGLHIIDYNAYMAAADAYAKEIKKINEQLAADPNDKDLIARKEALVDLQRQSIIAAEGEKDAIKDLVAQGIQLELAALKELIDEYEKSLDSAKNLYDYQKKISEKTSNVDKLQKQLTAYSGDDSEENRARVQKLNEELKRAQEDLAEAEYEQSIADQKKLLSELYEQYEDILNRRLDDVDALMQELIYDTNHHLDQIHEELSSVAEEVGYVMVDGIQSVMGQRLSYYDTAFTGITTVNSYLSKILSRIDDMVQAADSAAKTSHQESELPTDGYKYDDEQTMSEIGKIADGVDDGSKRPRKTFDELAEKFDMEDYSQKIGGGSASWFGAGDADKFLEAMKQLYKPTISTFSTRDFSLVANGGSASNGLTIGSVSVDINVENASSYEDILAAARNDHKFERLINSLVFDKMNGRSSFGGKNRIVL